VTKIKCRKIDLTYRPNLTAAAAERSVIVAVSYEIVSIILMHCDFNGPRTYRLAVHYWTYN
jgi:hypothetical protein